MNRYWGMDEENDSFGLELYQRLSQEQRIEYNSLIAKAEIDAATANSMEGILALSAGEQPLTGAWRDRIKCHWKNHYDTWLLARAVLMDATLRSERNMFIRQYFELGRLPSPQIPRSTGRQKAGVRGQDKPQHHRF